MTAFAPLVVLPVAPASGVVVPVVLAAPDSGVDVPVVEPVEPVPVSVLVAPPEVVLASVGAAVAAAPAPEVSEPVVPATDVLSAPVAAPGVAAGVPDSTELLDGTLLPVPPPHAASAIIAPTAINVRILK